jgi:hypothetical protein
MNGVIRPAKDTKSQINNGTGNDAVSDGVYYC